jgi:hypothetical protein
MEAMTMTDGVAYPGSSRCWDCGRDVEHEPRGGPQKRHWCRLRWLSRARWKAYQEGWHSGYRFAVENPEDELCRADGDDYGTGWAGHMRAGNLRVNL